MEEEGLVARNVARAVDPPRPRRVKMAILASEDIPKFLEAVWQTPYCALFYMALCTGMRLGELARLLREAGLLHIRFHDLKHIHATIMLKSGVHPKVVSEKLGHASVVFTLDTYSHVVPGIQEAAAERFDKMLEPDVSKGA